MDTAPLKSFATWARAALIREVAARIAVVLAPASPQRVEQPKAVAALENAITAAGGGEKGRGAVADRVAYTWFNRIIALRFMDANGYTGIGVVSPQAGVDVGQPEILAEAKRANIDPEVVSQKVCDTVTELLNGSRRSDDPQGEAYALLLAEYCRHWHRSMPFMFEREGDFTELLIPANLLADDSMINRAVKVLTEEVCQDVEVVGWLYQFYISERKDEVFAGFKKNKKAGADEIPAATQLFTPDWIVRYLVENSLGRLWMLNRPTSRLVDQMDYYVAPVDEPTTFLKVQRPEEIRVIDPACGSGHMLTYAFDLLYAIYEEEGYAPSDIPRLILANNLYGTEIDPRAGALAAFALAMKARERQRAFFSARIDPGVRVLEALRFTPQELNFLLTANGDRANEIVFWNQFENAETIGSLIRPDADLTNCLSDHLDQLDDGGDLISAEIIGRAARVIAQAEYLEPRYSIVVTNPPYMGGRNMDATFSAYAKDYFPSTKADLFAMFIERGRSLVVPRGYVAMITMQSWMFLSSYEILRKEVLAISAIRTLAHLGTGAFESIAGAVVSTCAFVIEATSSHTDSGVFLKLDDLPDEASKRGRLLETVSARSSSERFEMTGEQISRIPGWTLSYWMSAELLEALAGGRRLADVADPRVGLQTGDNGRFLRIWTEVSISSLARGCASASDALEDGRKWFPYNKGGSFRRWYGNQEFIVNWEHGGKELMAEKPKSVIRSPQYYFCESASWSKVGTSEPAFRYFPIGFIFDVAGTSIFARNHEELMNILAFGNSVVARELLRASAASMNLEVGTIAELPIRVTESAEVAVLAEKLVEAYRFDWDTDERSWNFSQLSFVDRTEPSVERAIAKMVDAGQKQTAAARELEEEINRYFLTVYGLTDMLDPEVQVENIALNANYLFRYGSTDAPAAKQAAVANAVQDLISYGVGCMFGRYSLDAPGLIVAEQGATLQHYLNKVPTPIFMPDNDNVIPIVDGDWFEDDIVTRFRKFLRAAFDDQHFEENLRFVTEALGVKDLRDYFVKSFYKDHVQRYKKRPIYWLFSSPKGSFNALIYLHRYTPATASTVLNEYLREFKAKLEATLGQQERLAASGGTPQQQAAAQKEADRIRKMLLELNEYEHDVLYPLASQQIEIDLDDGVKVNYPKFGAALKKIPGLEAAE
jgi:hypothetical protein